MRIICKFLKITKVFPLITGHTHRLGYIRLSYISGRYIRIEYLKIDYLFNDYLDISHPDYVLSPYDPNALTEKLFELLKKEQII